MKITLKDSTAQTIEVNGIEYHRTGFVTTSAAGIVTRYATADKTKTITMVKGKLMKTNPEEATVIFNPKNW